MDRFLKTCLVLIVLFLVVIALRLIVSPQSVHAQGQHKYVAVKTYGANASPGYRIQNVLDKYEINHIKLSWQLARSIPGRCRYGEEGQKEKGY